MTKLVYIKGDILKSDEHVIVHGCNCFNSMGAGIARQIRQQFPTAYAADIRTLPGDKSKLGTFTYAHVENVHGNSLYIVNAYTQYRYTRTEVDVDYPAYKKVFSKIATSFVSDGIIAMPRVGCGMASGDWNIASAILERVGIKYDTTFHIYDFEKSTGEDRLTKTVEEDEADWKVRLDRYRKILDKQYDR